MRKTFKLTLDFLIIIVNTKKYLIDRLLEKNVVYKCIDLIYVSML